MKVIMLYNYFAIIMKKKIKKMGITPPTNYLSQTPFLHEFCTLATTPFFHFFYYNENKLLIKQCLTNKDKNRNNKTDKYIDQTLGGRGCFSGGFGRRRRRLINSSFLEDFSHNPTLFLAQWP